jgi:hypothetical protein
MTDLITILSRLVNSQGEILIPGVKDLVPQPDKTELSVIQTYTEHGCSNY